MRTLLVLTVLGGGVAHATVAPALGIAGVTPDLPLIVVVLLALRRGPEFGCAAGFAAGLLQDAAGGGHCLKLRRSTDLRYVEDHCACAS